MPAKLFSREARRAVAEQSANQSGDKNAPIKWSFAELEYQLAALHDISPRHRTAFQARLKNFHKLGFPTGFKGVKGKAAQYGPGEIALFALAVELTQFGMAPERVVRMLVDDWFATTTAIRMAAQGILDSPETFSATTMPPKGERLAMFLHFDPNALANMKRGTPGLPREDLAIMSFFYGGQGVVRENLLRWTDNLYSCRLSLINVTALLYNMMGGRWGENDISQLAEARRQFFSQLVDWTIGFEPENANPQAAEMYLALYLHHCLDVEEQKWSRKEMVRELIARTGMPEELVRNVVEMRQKTERKK